MDNTRRARLVLYMGCLSLGGVLLMKVVMVLHIELGQHEKRIGEDVKAIQEKQQAAQVLTVGE